ncbi:MAG: BspA family leucine-rich repeat surface protein [Oscillospiraceae bacterium]|nr:BspA family leucine-rich repeat surface protein [Oscillospiraceae bacterium]MBR0392840.1 BspA family leucine-rich repeat surface protein [Oscillospiraceae bacterium]
MKRFRKTFCFLCCLAMLIGFSTVRAYASDTVIIVPSSEPVIIIEDGSAAEDAEAPLRVYEAQPGWSQNTLASDSLGSIISGSEAAEAPVFGSSIRRCEISSVVFTNSVRDMPDDAWDVSATYDRSVMAWATPDGNRLYELTIAAEGGVKAPQDCSDLFFGYTKLRSIRFGDAFHTDDVTNMDHMFSYCLSLDRLNLSSFNTSKVTNMSYMFAGCGTSSLDVSSFQTSQVRDMSLMFAVSGLLSLDLSSFDTANVTSMYGMFDSCNKLAELNVSSFNTANVTDMSWMFNGCTALRDLDLSSFNTAKVTSYNNFMPDELNPNWRSLFE